MAVPSRAQPDAGHPLNRTVPLRQCETSALRRRRGDRDGTDGSSDTFAETFVVTGTDLKRTFTCPKSGTKDLPATYTVDGNKLSIYETDPSSNVAGSVYVKQ